MRNDDPANLLSPKKRRKPKVKWFALMGFNVDNEDETGMLKLDDSSKTLYSITHDVKDALKFPSININNIKGFAKPEKWLKFFNSEPLLVNWKFHLISVKNDVE